LSGLQKVMSDLTQLNYLGLSSMSYAVPDLTTVEMGMFIDHISSLPNLEHLKLSNNPKIVTIRESIGSLRKLRNLDISACKNLEASRMYG
jgi:Leucine-rich repeat (LRR) protein